MALPVLLGCVIGGRSGTGQLDLLGLQTLRKPTMQRGPYDTTRRPQGEPDRQAQAQRTKEQAGMVWSDERNRPQTHHGIDARRAPNGFIGSGSYQAVPSNSGIKLTRTAGSRTEGVSSDAPLPVA